ncbi:MAG TPA: hypothetical protein VFN49_09140 [Candidatus Aquilonibacter sp.]|nr:hypothetical protein [Candidatus Aquilonibacter sp.]
MSATPPTASNARGPGWPLAATILWGLLMLPGFVAAMMSPMMFDAPGSLEDRSLTTVAGAVVAFPLLCLVSIALTWAVWSATRERTGTEVTATLAACFALPVLPIVVIAIVALLHRGS